MDMKHFLDELMKSGKDMAVKTQDVAEKTLGIPEQGEKRDTMMSGLKVGGAVAGVLALLLGTKTGRSAAGNMAKVGGVAALGGLAYQMYQKWQQNQDNNTPAQAATTPLQLEALEERTPTVSNETLLRAMVSAAKADGHVDENEMAAIKGKLSELDLDQDVNDLLLGELTSPVDVAGVAALAEGDKKAALEIYLASKMLIDEQNDSEKQYLKDLQAALGLPDAAVQLI